MSVDDVYKIILYCVAKNRQDGYVSPDDFNLIINQGQRGYFDYLKGEYQKYQVQRPIAVVEFGQNEMVRQSLAPFIYGAVLSPNTTTGIAAFPSDFEYHDAMWGLYGFYNIRFIQQDRQDSYLHSQIDPIRENPVFLIRHEGFQFFPEDIGAARMSYLRTPPSMVWAYTLDSDGVPQYNPFLSQQPVWGESDIMQVIVRALSIFGVNLQFGVVLQYANDVKNGGQ